MNPCPSPEQLRDFLAEVLLTPEAGALEAHVEQCADCQQALERLTASPKEEGGRMKEESEKSPVLIPSFRLPPSGRAAALLRRLENRPATVIWTRSAAGRPPAAEAAGPPVVPGYEILGELGRGGMGVVYRARHLVLDRVVALKMILRASPEARARFRVEAQAVARLRHPHIVQVHDFDEVDGQPYFCLEYVEGGSLEARARHAPQPPALAARLAEQVAAAMQHAHDKGVVHRDLKPANVLLTADGTPKVTDFGLAKVAQGEPGALAPRGGTVAGAIMGTPSYMAPEQARGREVGPAADVWAVGALLYDLLTGRPPFYGETAQDTLLQVIAEEPVPPRRLQPKVPRDLETICLKCLEKEPVNRYPSAQKLADDLANFREGRPIWARPVGPLGRAVRWVKREPRTAALVALALASALLLAGAGLWRARVQAERQAERAQRQAELKERAEDQLDEAEGLETAARADRTGEPAPWEAALKAARRAEELAARVEDDEEFRQRATGLRADLEAQARDRRLAWRLADLRLRRADPGSPDLDGADRAYARAFDDYGIPVDLNSAKAAERVKASPVAGELVAALDDWALVRRSLGRPRALWRRPSEVARRADPDPRRNRVRAALWKEDLPALRERTAAWDLGGLPPATLVLLGNRLLFLDDHAEAVRVLRRAWQAHRNDFWVAHALASAHLPQPAEADEAVRAFSAAVALRPGAARARSNLAAALNQKARLLARAPAPRPPAAARDVLAEAEAEARQAIRLAPDYALAHNNLGLALRGQGRLAEAAEAYRAALRLAPHYALAHNNLGIALGQLRRWEEASCCYHRAVALDPGYARAHDNLGLALAARGRFADAALAHRTAGKLDPNFAEAHHNLGAALSRLDRPGEAVVAYREAARLRPDSALFHYTLALELYKAGRVAGAAVADRRALQATGDRLRSGRAPIYAHLGRCLHLLGHLDEAIASYRRAAQLRPDLAVRLNGLGDVLQAGGRVEEAADAYRHALCLRHDSALASCSLGRVYERQGRLAEARVCLERGHALGGAELGWNSPSERWAKEARLLVALEPCLPALLAREAIPAGPAGAGVRARLAGLAALLPGPVADALDLNSPPVRVLLARLCAVRGHHGAAARLYREAFADLPALAALASRHRLRAARSAALAGCGRGAGKLDEGARALLRAQALAWLRADLGVMGKRVSSYPPARRRDLLLALREWQHDPDLAGVREPTALAALPGAERGAWRELWAEVAALAARAFA